MLEALRRLYWDEFVKWTYVEDCEWRLDILNNNMQELHSQPESSNTFENYRISNKLEIFIYSVYSDLNQYFMSDFHTVSRSKAASTCNCVPTDMIHEQGV